MCRQQAQGGGVLAEVTRSCLTGPPMPRKTSVCLLRSVLNCLAVEELAFEDPPSVEGPMLAFCKGLSFPWAPCQAK